MPEDRSHPNWKHLECVGKGWREPLVAPLIRYIERARTTEFNGGRAYRYGTKWFCTWWWSRLPRRLPVWVRNIGYRIINWAVLNKEIPLYGHDVGVVPVILQVKEKFGGLRFYAANTNNFFDGMVHMAEEASYRICEQCGNAATPTTDGGWVLTLCKECKDARRRS